MNIGLILDELRDYYVQSGMLYSSRGWGGVLLAESLQACPPKSSTRQGPLWATLGFLSRVTLCPCEAVARS